MAVPLNYWLLSVRSGGRLHGEAAAVHCCSKRVDIFQSISVVQHPLEEGFQAAWSRVNEWATKWARVPECAGCAYEGICENCAANVILYGEPGKQPTKLCERTMYLVQHGVYRMQECE